jgi:hypothetical protein
MLVKAYPVSGQPVISMIHAVQAEILCDRSWRKRRSVGRLTEQPDIAFCRFFVGVLINNNYLIYSRCDTRSNTYMEAVDMGIMQRNGICEDTGDCLITSMAFIAVVIAWIMLVCWMVCDKF